MVGKAEKIGFCARFLGYCSSKITKYYPNKHIIISYYSREYLARVSLATIATDVDETERFHEELAVKVCLCRLAICCVLREQFFFSIRTDWFFLLVIRFSDFQTVLSTQNR